LIVAALSKRHANDLNTRANHITTLQNPACNPAFHPWLKIATSCDALFGMALEKRRHGYETLR